jgi:hypothetical protein
LTHVGEAQAVIDQHSMSLVDGMCRRCGVPAPCAAHEWATRVFRLAVVLPRRVPGGSRPELTGAKRRDFNWLSARAVS